jgi:hypothetical protein
MKRQLTAVSLSTLVDLTPFPLYFVILLDVCVHLGQ